METLHKYLFLTFKEISKLFFQNLRYLSTRILSCSSSPHLVWPIFLILAFLICIFYCGFNLHFKWLMMSNIFHGFFPINLWEFFMYFEYWSFIKLQSTNIFSICSLLFVQFISGCLIKNLSSSLTEAAFNSLQASPQAAQMWQIAA